MEIDKQFVTPMAITVNGPVWGETKQMTILWNHDLKAPQFWKRCQCGTMVGPFPSLAAAQGAVSCQRCLDEFKAKLRRARCQTSE